jgi:chromate reductase
MQDSDRLVVRVLTGSLRKGSFNRGLQRALPELAPDTMRVEALDGMGELPLYDEDLEATSFPHVATQMAEEIRRADGLIICTPEYNNSVPGVLKNAIDWLSRLPKQPFSEKPVALMSVSTGSFGGARSQMALRPALVTLNALVLNRPNVLIANARQKFDLETGDLRDGGTREQVRKQLVAFEAWIRRLAPR